MPAPDPFGLIYDEAPNGAPRVIAEVWPSSGWFPGNPRHRKNRMIAVYRNLRRDGWCCPWCGGFVPIYRRADAVFCSTSCRRKAAYQRRKTGGQV